MSGRKREKERKKEKEKGEEREKKKIKHDKFSCTLMSTKKK
jgi:hypothetical protein